VQAIVFSGDVADAPAVESAAEPIKGELVPIDVGSVCVPGVYGALGVLNLNRSPGNPSRILLVDR
jgi:hypothetical protein